MPLRVGMLLPSASRRAGGLFSAVSSLSTQLAHNGYDLQVFAAEDPDIEADRKAWGTVALSLRPTQGPAVFAYRPSLTRDLAAAQLDVVHLHGLWTYASVAALAWSGGRRPRVISPHGMVDSWALQNSALKKRIAAALFERRNVMQGDALHALCGPEHRAIRAYGYRGPVATIPNGVFLEEGPASPARPAWSSNIPAGAKVLLFLGRVHPKKGLDRLLQAMALWSGAEADPWHLVVAGWDQAGTEAALAAQAEALGLAQRVHFVGPQFGEQKAATLAAADAFVLPSLSEGLPMAVLEAWAARLPVLMTEACNLPEGFRAGAAIRLAPDPTAMAEGLRKLGSLSQPALDTLAVNGRALVEAQFSWGHVACQMGQLYEWVLGGGTPPAFVETD
jgi:glycosyltransferase involved in cell wall biosynthesis